MRFLRPLAYLLALVGCGAGAHTSPLLPDSGTSSTAIRDAAGRLAAGDSGACAASLADETGCPCTRGESRACYTGPPSTRGAGTCHDGQQTCVAGTGEFDESGVFGACLGESLPSPSSGCMRDAGAPDASAPPAHDAAVDSKPPAQCVLGDAGAANGVLLFGGNNSDEVEQGDTWNWDGTAWTELNVSGPSARDYVAMATSGAGVVSFGGADPASDLGYLAETWAWNGSSWTEAASGPSARVTQMAALDGAVLLFGGCTGESCGQSLDDTWLWNGTSWAQQSVTGPSARAYAAMARLNDTIVLFGGLSQVGGGTGSVLSDTWTWDGASWTQHQVTGPSGRYYHSMATAKCGVVLFGGQNLDHNVLGDTWTWDGTSWTEQNVTGPPARIFQGMTSLGKNAVLFGGEGDSGVLDDTWTWDGTSWTQENVSGPGGRVAFGMASW